MSEDEFRGYLSQLKFNNGIIHVGDSRYVLMPTSWLTDLMLELENLMGVSGTFALLDSASKKTKITPTLLAAVKDLPFEHKIGAFLKNSALTGFANMEIEEISKEPFKIVLKNPAPIFDDAYQGGADGPRCYFNATFIPWIEAMVKFDGIDGPLK